MFVPTQGEIRLIYCDCLHKKQVDSFKSSQQGTSERIVTDNSTGTTSWICKCKYVRSFSRKTGFFSSEVVGIWQYFWECMNCGKTRVIGNWDGDGNGHGNDA